MIELTLDDIVSVCRHGSRVLLMVRHGERPKMDHDDPSFGEYLPLTASGLRQAERFGEILRGAVDPADVQFLASPLRRTYMTAQAIARGMSLAYAPIPTAPELGNSSFYFSDRQTVFELFRTGEFFKKIFQYFEHGQQAGFTEINAATDALEQWCLDRFTGRLGIFTTHDLYNAAFLFARGVVEHFTVENWTRFLDATAIIIQRDGTRRYALVRAGLSSGVCGVSVPAPQTGLVMGARSGRYPLEILAREPNMDLAIHAYDCHQARKINEDLIAANAYAEVICAPDLPPSRQWDKAFFYHDRLASAELQLDTLQALFQHVKSGVNAHVEGVDALIRKKAVARIRDFSATFEASVPGGPKLSFVSLPGCFCHRRADEGGLALAEVAVRDTPSKPQAILDIGCGCGLVGLLVADAQRRIGFTPSHLTFIDSHTRAIAATQLNVSALDFQANCLLSDTGIVPEDEQRYDLVLANPPYYGDWSIAECFVTCAKRALKPGGILLAVAKSPKGLAEVITRLFDTPTIIKRRGYAILRAVKPVAQ